MKNKLKIALRLRFEYYNSYEGKENIWHEKYKEHNLYSVVVKSFEYDFKKIAEMMPKLLEQSEKNL
ncbi:hypothetical protein CKA55_03015 [Arcobacter suis]|mgnify:CR=1 FL=1|uniref:Uncharacterized protein n=1 Tax=Arcobacter suis CECT 7833 TaxID=663365 RepID=A0AAD0SNN5_9BACT|nr:hypothetical protein [Arcobacter suis]AXX88824.1 hypothetical protein ASUIS_0316 [Arcobacter suis CECT 7833]RWS47383.1 hypothetical protein CKA55_03015 [Arcobacter suis]